MIAASNHRNRLWPLIVILSVSMALLASGCLWGVVRDARTGAGLSGATVRYTDSEGRTASTTTGVNGLYVFDVATGRVPRAGPAAFRLNAAGYDLLKATRLIEYDDNPSASLDNPSSFWEIQHFDLVAEGAAGYIATAAAGLSFPVGVVYDRYGNLYFSERAACRVRKVAAGTGVISNVAGTGVCGFSGDGGPATSAQLNLPTGLALDPKGHLAIVDSGNCRVRKVDLETNVITTVAGNGICGFSGDGGPATSASLALSDVATVPTPWVWSDIAFDAPGNLYIADPFNCRVRRVNTRGTITTVAGSGPTGFFTCGAFAGDGGAATAARLHWPTGLAVNTERDIFVAEMGNCRIRRIDGGSGIIETVVGSGSCVSSGDGGPALSAGLANPRGFAMDAAGDLYISEFRFVGDLPSVAECNVRHVDMGTGIIETVAGSDICGFGGDGGRGASARVNTPADIALKCDGHVAFAESANGRIRVVWGMDSGGAAPDSDGDGLGGLWEP